MATVQQILRNRLSVTASNEPRWKACLVKLNRDFGFFSLGQQVWQKILENADSALSANLNHKQMPVLFRITEMARPIFVERKAVKIAHRFDGARIGHFDCERKYVSRTAASVFIVRPEATAFNRDAAFAVKQSCKVGKFVNHETHGITNIIQRPGSHQQNPANSADTRPHQGEGNAELNTNNREMCREHIRDPKGMTCSELRSNAKRAAEMTAPVERRVTTLQDARTAQIQWYGAAGVTNRRKHGVDSDIDTTVTS